MVVGEAKKEKAAARVVRRVVIELIHLPQFQLVHQLLPRPQFQRNHRHHILHLHQRLPNQLLKVKVRRILPFYQSFSQLPPPLFQRSLLQSQLRFRHLAQLLIQHLSRLLRDLIIPPPQSRLLFRHQAQLLIQHLSQLLILLHHQSIRLLFLHQAHLLNQ